MRFVPSQYIFELTKVLVYGHGVGFGVGFNDGLAEVKEFSAA
jgi:hypothetical protein